MEIVNEDFVCAELRCFIFILKKRPQFESIDVYIKNLLQTVIQKNFEGKERCIGILKECIKKLTDNAFDQKDIIWQAVKDICNNEERFKMQEDFYYKAIQGFEQQASKKNSY